MEKKPQPQKPDTPEDIYRKEIRPHEGGVIGPSPEGNVHDSHIPPPRRSSSR